MTTISPKTTYYKQGDKFLGHVYRHLPRIGWLGVVYTDGDADRMVAFPTEAEAREWVERTVAHELMMVARDEADAEA